MNDAADPAPEPRLVLVTGASRGLGYAVASALGARGDHVVALARTVGALEQLADAIEAAGGPAPTLVPVSLTDTAGLQRLGLALHERWGYLSAVVHCAAHAAPLAPAPHMADKDFDASVEVNFRGTERLVVMMAPLLLARPGGRFVYTADTRAGQPFYGAYGATKAAAEALVRSWAAETVRLGPKVDLFHPNPMPTALRGRFYPGEDNTTLPPCSVEAERMIETLGL